MTGGGVMARASRKPPEFAGLMALLAGIERADIDLGYALSLPNPDTKNRNIEAAREALRGGLRDFKRESGE